MFRYGSHVNLLIYYYKMNVKECRFTLKSVLEIDLGIMSELIWNKTKKNTTLLTKKVLKEQTLFFSQNQKKREQKLKQNQKYTFDTFAQKVKRAFNLQNICLP